MAQSLTAPTHLEAASDNEATNPTATNLISFKKGAGPGSYFYFESNPDAKFFKTRASECLNTLKYLDANHVSEYLDEMIPDAFQREAAKNRITLDQLVEILKEMPETSNQKASSCLIAQDEKMLATMIAKMGPNRSPQDLMVEFKALCDSHMDAAVDFLAECEKKNGRNEDGWIYLRHQRASMKGTKNSEGVDHA